MSEFTPKRIDLETINGGKKYKNGDGISPADLNALVEGVGASDCTEELDKVKFFVGYREAVYVKRLETNFFTNAMDGTFYVGGNIDIWENNDIENTTYLIKNDALGIRVVKKGSGEYFTHTFTPPASGEQTVSIGIYGAMAEGWYGLCITNIFADVQTLTFDGVFEVYEVIYQEGA